MSDESMQNAQPHQPGAPWSIKDAAAFLGISLRHLKTQMKLERIRSVKIGGRVILSDKEVQRVATEGC